MRGMFLSDRQLKGFNLVRQKARKAPAKSRGFSAIIWRMDPEVENYVVQGTENEATTGFISKL